MSLLKDNDNLPSINAANEILVDSYDNLIRILEAQSLKTLK